MNEESLSILIQADDHYEGEEEEKYGGTQLLEYIEQEGEDEAKASIIFPLILKVVNALLGCNANSCSFILIAIVRVEEREQEYLNASRKE
jgi:hypothetical protein